MEKIYYFIHVFLKIIKVIENQGHGRFANFKFLLEIILNKNDNTVSWYNTNIFIIFFIYLDTENKRSLISELSKIFALNFIKNDFNLMFF